MKINVKVVLFAVAVSACLFVAGARAVAAQSRVEVKPLAERLGYPAATKLLIVHADDLGVAHSVNAATFEALAGGAVNSGSVMVPCPWLTEVVAYARAHTEADLGLHLTLTSEWETYRWGGVLGRERAPSLYDSSGYFYATEAEAAAHIDVKEAEAEVRAQIARARALGISPTHLDSHMGTLYQSRPLFEMFLRVARDERLPVRVSREWFGRDPYLAAALGTEGVVLDRVITIDPSVKPDGWADFYRGVIKNLGPGVTELVVHLARDDEEMRAVTTGHPDWGAAWRQREFSYLTGAEFKRLLEENGVRLVTWREIGRLLAKR